MVFQERIVFIVVVNVLCHPDLIFVNDCPVFFAVSRIDHGIVFDVFIEKVFLRQFSDLAVFGKIPTAFVANVILFWERIAWNAGVVYNTFLVAELVLFCGWGYMPVFKSAEYAGVRCVVNSYVTDPPTSN